MPASRAYRKSQNPKRERKKRVGLAGPKPRRAAVISRLPEPHRPSGTKGPGRGRGEGSRVGPGRRRRLLVHLGKGSRPGRATAPARAPSSPALPQQLAPGQGRAPNPGSPRPARAAASSGKPALGSSTAGVFVPVGVPAPPLPPQNLSAQYQRHVLLGDVQSGARWTGAAIEVARASLFSEGGKRRKRVGPASRYYSSEAGGSLLRGQLARAPQGALAGAGRGAAGRPGACTWWRQFSRPNPGEPLLSRGRRNAVPGPALERRLLLRSPGTAGPEDRKGGCGLARAFSARGDFGVGSRRAAERRRGAERPTHGR